MYILNTDVFQMNIYVLLQNKVPKERIFSPRYGRCKTFMLQEISCQFRRKENDRFYTFRGKRENPIIFSSNLIWFSDIDKKKKGDEKQIYRYSANESVGIDNKHLTVLI